MKSEDFNRYYAAKLENAKCELCGSEGWDVAGGSDECGEYGVPIVNKQGRIHIGIFITALALVCRDCGNLKFLSLNAIKRWMDANVSTEQ
ncbi:conserved hypothetical protein [uncultured Gammaproteobacteria bacterium]